MPKVFETVKKLFDKEPSKGVNPDEVVALGAAVQGGVLAGDVKDVLLLDVTPLTLSIETLGRVATPMIKRNTTIPSSKSQTFSTAADSQTQVEVHVVQGERPMTIDNKSLGRFVLDGIPPAPRGIPQIEVSFDIDANGILNVAAKDKATGKEQKITIKGSTGLDEEEVDKMTKEAEKHSEEDQLKKELIEVKNKADNLCFAAEKTIKDAGDKISAEDKKQLEDEISKVKELLKKEDITKETVEMATKDLSDKLQPIGEKMYKEQAKEQEQAQKKEGKAPDAKEDTKEKGQQGDKKDKDKEGKGKAEEGEVVE